MIIKRKRMKDNIKAAFWTITIFSFLFQCYFRSLSQFIVPALIVFLLLEISNVKLKHPRGWLMVFSGYCVFLAFSAVVSFYKGKYSLQGTTQGRYLTGGVPPVRFSM